MHTSYIIHMQHYFNLYSFILSIIFHPEDITVGVRQKVSNVFLHKLVLQVSP